MPGRALKGSTCAVSTLSMAVLVFIIGVWGANVVRAEAERKSGAGALFEFKAMQCETQRFTDSGTGAGAWFGDLNASASAASSTDACNANENGMSAEYSAASPVGAAAIPVQGSRNASGARSAAIAATGLAMEVWFTRNTTTSETTAALPIMFLGDAQERNVSGTTCGTSDQCVFSLTMVGDKLRFYFTFMLFGIIQMDLVANPDMPANMSEPVHFAFSWNNTLRVFVNGELVEEVVAEYDRSDLGDVWLEDFALQFLGTPNVNTNWGTFGGTVHLFSMYDRALSNDAVAENYRAGIPSTVPAAQSAVWALPEDGAERSTTGLTNSTVLTAIRPQDLASVQFSATDVDHDPDRIGYNASTYEPYMIEVLSFDSALRLYSLNTSSASLDSASAAGANWTEVKSSDLPLLLSDDTTYGASNYTLHVRPPFDNDNESTQYEIVFRARDGETNEFGENATLTVQLYPVNDAPEATPSSVSVYARAFTQVSMDFLDQDSDVTNASIAISTLPANGQLFQAASGSSSDDDGDTDDLAQFGIWDEITTAGQKLKAHATSVYYRYTGSINLTDATLPVGQDWFQFVVHDNDGGVSPPASVNVSAYSPFVLLNSSTSSSALIDTAVWEDGTDGNDTITLAALDVSFGGLSSDNSSSGNASATCSSLELVVQAFHGMSLYATSPQSDDGDDGNHTVWSLLSPGDAVAFTKQTGTVAAMGLQGNLYTATVRAVPAQANMFTLPANEYSGNGATNDAEYTNGVAVSWNDQALNLSVFVRENGTLDAVTGGELFEITVQNVNDALSLSLQTEDDDGDVELRIAENQVLQLADAVPAGLFSVTDVDGNVDLVRVVVETDGRVFLPDTFSSLFQPGCSSTNCECFTPQFTATPCTSIADLYTDDDDGGSTIDLREWNDTSNWRSSVVFVGLPEEIESALNSLWLFEAESVDVSIYDGDAGVDSRSGCIDWSNFDTSNARQTERQGCSVASVSLTVELTEADDDDASSGNSAIYMLPRSWFGAYTIWVLLGTFVLVLCLLIFGMQCCIKRLARKCCGCGAADAEEVDSKKQPGGDSNNIRNNSSVSKDDTKGMGGAGVSGHKSGDIEQGGAGIMSDDKTECARYDSGDSGDSAARNARTESAAQRPPVSEEQKLEFWTGLPPAQRQPTQPSASAPPRSSLAVALSAHDVTECDLSTGTLHASQIGGSGSARTTSPANSDSSRGSSPGRRTIRSTLARLSLTGSPAERELDSASPRLATLAADMRQARKSAADASAAAGVAAAAVAQAKSSAQHNTKAAVHVQHAAPTPSPPPSPCATPPPPLVSSRTPDRTAHAFDDWHRTSDVEHAGPLSAATMAYSLERPPPPPPKRPRTPTETVF